ncbi:MAG TPA: hypothetical protein VFP65_16795 [Anaeromyxobacteraceae bacterium]|nr:hypothetical protein [Anaeromyxobacteraceae bacterium]
MSTTLRLTTALAIVAALAAPAAARAEVWTASIEGFAGWQNLQLSTASVGNAVSGDEGTTIVGGDFLAGYGLLGIGAVIDKTVSGTNQPWAGAAMLGILVPLTAVRLELMGELGQRARDFGDIFGNGQTFLGVRPGISFRFAPTPLIIGVSGIGRWNTSGGSGDYGIVGRIGFGIF